MNIWLTSDLYPLDINHTYSRISGRTHDSLASRSSCYGGITDFEIELAWMSNARGATGSPSNAAWASRLRGSSYYSVHCADLTVKTR